MSAASFLVRPLRAADSLEALTTLLHRAYAPLGAAGMNFTAVDQTVEQTRERVGRGQCFVAERDGAVIGTATVSGAYDPNRHGWARATPWCFRTDVANLQQYAVDPAAQGAGIGTALLAACEDWAREHGHSALALDTAVPATHLRRRYERAGFRTVDEVQWGGKAYRSVIMAKPLAEPAPQAGDAEHHAAMVRALWACVEARDWSAARKLFNDDAQVHWFASGEHLLDADAIIRVNAIYPEGWAIDVREVTGMADGRVHSMVVVRQDGQRYIAHSLWRFAGGRIAHVHETWAAAEAPPAWRTAEAIGNYRREDFV
jgi:GNAT superfamily N-acetyltransferase